MNPNQRIYASDLAKLLGKTERTARRLLESLEVTHGAAVVRREGRERYATRTELERVGVLSAREREHESESAKLMNAVRRLLSDIAALVERVDALDLRVTDLAVRVAHVRA